MIFQNYMPGVSAMQISIIGPVQGSFITIWQNLTQPQQKEKFLVPSSPTFPIRWFSIGGLITVCGGFMITPLLSNFLCCMPYSGMQHSIYWRHLIYAGVLLCWGGGFRLYMYPRVGLASSPVPARACSTTRSTMRVSSEDTESSDLHVHAGYPVTD